MVKGLKAEERRRFYGFVDARIPPVDDGIPRSRETLLLDCVDAKAFDRRDGAVVESEELALIRVLSTRRRLEEDYGLPIVSEGDWLELTVAKEPGSPRAWVMPADSDYLSEGAENIRAITLLPDPDAATAAGRTAAKLQKAYRLGDDVKKARAGDLRKLLPDMSQSGLEVRAVDVGQASCNLILRDGQPIGYFDAGAPLYRNQRSFHGRLCHRPPKKGFVLLSHWDFDHFDLGRRRPELQQLIWFAPDQPVGPNAYKFQLSLGTNLCILTKAFSFPGVELRPGLATNEKDRNGRGYSLKFKVGNELVVLTGDCAYDLIDPAILTGATAITIPHHGGRSNAPPPPVSGRGVAVASYGKPNCYRHPEESYLQLHQGVGWHVSRTAAHPSNWHARGSRRLAP